MGISLRSPPLDTLLQRVRGEYREMPGLRLTLPQAQRLFGLERVACLTILKALVTENFLSCTCDDLSAHQQYGMSPNRVRSQN